MKFTCDGKNLSSAVNLVSRVLSVKSNIPVLDGIKIKAQENTVTFSVYNQEIYIEKSIPAQVLLEGELIVEEGSSMTIPVKFTPGRCGDRKSG